MRTHKTLGLVMRRAFARAVLVAGVVVLSAVLSVVVASWAQPVIVILGAVAAYCVVRDF